MNFTRMSVFPAAIDGRMTLTGDSGAPCRTWDCLYAEDWPLDLKHVWVS